MSDESLILLARTVGIELAVSDAKTAEISPQVLSMLKREIRRLRVTPKTTMQARMLLRAYARLYHPAMRGRLSKLLKYNPKRICGAMGLPKFGLPARLKPRVANKPKRKRWEMKDAAFQRALRDRRAARLVDAEVASGQEDAETQTIVPQARKGKLKWRAPTGSRTRKIKLAKKKQEVRRRQQKQSAAAAKNLGL